MNKNNEYTVYQITYESNHKEEAYKSLDIDKCRKYIESQIISLIEEQYGDWFAIFKDKYFVLNVTSLVKGEHIAKPLFNTRDSETEWLLKALRSTSVLFDQKMGSNDWIKRDYKYVIEGVN